MVQTPLFKACQKGYDSLVNKLLKYKPNLEILRNGESVSKIILYDISKSSFFLLVSSCCNNV